MNPLVAKEFSDLIGSDYTQIDDATPESEKGAVNGHHIVQVAPAATASEKKKVTFDFSDEETASMTNTDVTDVTGGSNSPVAGILKEVDVWRDVPDKATGPYSQKLSKAYDRLHALAQSVPRPVDDSIIEKYQEALELLSAAIDVTVSAEKQKNPDIKTSFDFWQKFAEGWINTIEHYSAIDKQLRSLSEGLGLRVEKSFDPDWNFDGSEDSFSVRFYNLLKQDELLVGDYNCYAKAFLHGDELLQARIASDIKARQKVIDAKTAALSFKEYGVSIFSPYHQEALHELYQSNRSTEMLKASYRRSERAVDHMIKGNSFLSELFSKMARLQKELSAAMANNKESEVRQKNKALQAYREAIDAVSKVDALAKKDSNSAQCYQFIADCKMRRARSIEKNENPQVAENYNEAARLGEDVMFFLSKAETLEDKDKSLAALWMEVAQCKDEAACATGNGNKEIASRWNMIAATYEEAANFLAESIQAAADGYEELAQTEKLKSQQATQKAKKLLEVVENPLFLNLFNLK